MEKKVWLRSIPGQMVTDLIPDFLVFYTGTTGDPVPVVKGWLRTSLREVCEEHPQHRPYLPYRNYFSDESRSLEAGTVYPVDVEIWPTCVVIEPGEKLVLEIASCDTQGAGIFEHNHPHDRCHSRLKGWNRVHFGNGYSNYLTLPVIPPKV